MRGTDPKGVTTPLKTLITAVTNDRLELTVWLNDSTELHTRAYRTGNLTGQDGFDDIDSFDFLAMQNEDEWSETDWNRLIQVDEQPVLRSVIMRPRTSGWTTRLAVVAVEIADGRPIYVE